MKVIPFNKPYIIGKEFENMKEALDGMKLSGNGLFTKKCHDFFVQRYGFKKTLLTTSCTDALEMAALLINLNPGDEVIIPSFTFVSTANAFILRGAKIVFADSRSDNPDIDEDQIESLITNKTKAIVPVHYAGVACDMDKIMALAKKYNLFVIEDAAQAVDSYYKGKPLGGIGHLGAFSFHETKNVISGEGGMLAINDEQFLKRSEIIWEKGTNRSAFWRGEVNKYGWMDVGSSFLPSEIIAAFLAAQLENIDKIQKRRKEIWAQYYEGLEGLYLKGLIKLPQLPDGAYNNAHMFYVVFSSLKERQQIIGFLKNKGISAVFHYISLHKSPYYSGNHDGRILKNSDHYTDCLLRLPFFYELETGEVAFVIDSIKEFFDG